MITTVMCALDHEHVIDTECLDERSECLYTTGQCLALAVGIHGLLGEGLVVVRAADEVLHCYGIHGDEWIDVLGCHDPDGAMEAWCDAWPDATATTIADPYGDGATELVRTMTDLDSQDFQSALMSAQTLLTDLGIDY